MVTPKVATTLGDALDRLDGAHLEGRALRWERSIRSRPAIAACIAINKRLTNQREDVLALWADRGHEFNAVNFATAIYQLGKRGRRELGRTAAYRRPRGKTCSLVPACDVLRKATGPLSKSVFLRSKSLSTPAGTGAC